MTKIIIFTMFIISFNTFAKPLELDVISAEFGVEDQLQNKSLCLTVVRVPATGALLGLVEGITDCFYTRQAKKAAHIKVEMKDFKKIGMPELEQHLQTLDTQLKFYFSYGE